MGSLRGEMGRNIAFPPPPGWRGRAGVGGMAGASAVSGITDSCLVRIGRGGEARRADGRMLGLE